MDVAGKHIVVLGLARSGESVARLLSSKGARVTVLDSGISPAIDQRAELLQAIGIAVRTGPTAACDEPIDLVVISPGIDLGNAMVRTFSERGIPITGELEVAWQFCKKPVIAITGTNGKTTTTELISAMLNRVGKTTVACGNIGLPFSEVVGTMQDSLDYVTVEVSSFQLETIRTFRPMVALWLNFSPDHLDRYASMADYRAAKLRIFENQTGADFAVCSVTDDLPGLAARTITFNASGKAADFIISEDSITFRGQSIARLDSFQLVGLHNAENLMAALATGHVLGFDFEEMLPVLREYKAAPHRCELVAVVNGVRYLNDSKATNVDAMARAISSVNGHLILIAGGKDKGFEFSSIRELIAEKVASVVLIGEMAEHIARDWSGAAPCQIAMTLQDAVDLAHAHAPSDSTVLFSPGTSSFDMFRDYADRGAQFGEAVQSLSNIASHSTMNIKDLFPKAKPKKLNTTTRRATMPVAEEYDTDEPNVRLSRAFLVVMLLHVVAVGGIFAFSSIKKNTPAPLEVATPETAVKTDLALPESRLHTVTSSDTLGSIASTYGLTRNDLETANHLNASSKIIAGDKLVIPTKSTAQPVPLNVQKLLQLSQAPKPLPPSQPVKTARENPLATAPKPVKIAEPIAPADSKFYVVQKGDNPVLIAKKQGIKYLDLIEANKITDPKKLQIGQKLIIPQK